MATNLEDKIKELEAKVAELYDREALRDLRYRYHECINEAQMAAIPELFTEDGELDFAAGVIEARELRWRGCGRTSPRRSAGGSIDSAGGGTNRRITRTVRASDGTGIRRPRSHGRADRPHGRQRARSQGGASGSVHRSRARWCARVFPAALQRWPRGR